MMKRSFGSVMPGIPVIASGDWKYIMKSQYRHLGIGVTTLVVAVALLVAGCGCSPAPVKPKAEGSGCSGLKSTIPAGTWYGGVKSASTTKTISFDVVCLFNGPNAVAAGIEDGKDPIDAQDFYIRNQSAVGRNVPVCSNAKAYAPKYLNGDGYKQLTISNYLKQVKGTLNDPSIYSYSGLTKMTVRSSGACASVLTQVYTP